MFLPDVSKTREWGIAALRMVVGLVFLVHGGQKLFMFGFAGTAGFFESIGIPAPMASAVLVTFVELLGGLALILGLGTRWVAIPLAITMITAFFTVHLSNGFFIGNNGYEFVLTLFVANITLVLAGPGALSVDEYLANRQPSSPRERVSSRPVTN